MAAKKGYRVILTGPSQLELHKIGGWIVREGVPASSLALDRANGEWGLFVKSSQYPSAVTAFRRVLRNRRSRRNQGKRYEITFYTKPQGSFDDFNEAFKFAAKVSREKEDISKLYDTETDTTFWFQFGQFTGMNLPKRKKGRGKKNPWYVRERRGKGRRWKTLPHPVGYKSRAGARAAMRRSAREEEILRRHGYERPRVERKAVFSKKPIFRWSAKKRRAVRMNSLLPATVPFKTAKRIVNSYLAGLGKKPLPEIPMNSMMDFMEVHGITPLDEDGTPLTGVILTGWDGRATFPITYHGRPVNSMWVLSWHKFDTGRYEVVSYLS